jgi:hypothetical protein
VCAAEIRHNLGETLEITAFLNTELEVITNMANEEVVKLT